MGFEPVISAIPVRCSTNWAMKPHWERGQLIEFISSREEWNDVKYIWNNSYLNCGCRWKWRMIIVVNFKQLERRSLKKSGLQQDSIKLENLLQWSFFTFILNHSSNMNYFIYTSHHFTPLLPMCGFIAQLVEHRTGIVEVTSSNSVETQIFSGFFFPIA